MTAKSVTSFSGRHSNSVKSPRQYQKVKPNSVCLGHTFSDLSDLLPFAGYHGGFINLWKKYVYYSQDDRPVAHCGCPAQPYFKKNKICSEEQQILSPAPFLWLIQDLYCRSQVCNQIQQSIWEQHGKLQSCGIRQEYATTALLIVTLRGVYDKTYANIFYIVFHRERHF